MHNYRPVVSSNLPFPSLWGWFRALKSCFFRDSLSAFLASSGGGCGLFHGFSDPCSSFFVRHRTVTLCLLLFFSLFLLSPAAQRSAAAYHHDFSDHSAQTSRRRYNFHDYYHHHCYSLTPDSACDTGDKSRCGRLRCLACAGELFAPPILPFLVYFSFGLHEIFAGTLLCSGRGELRRCSFPFHSRRALTEKTSPH